MKINIVITALLATLLGLGMGYFLFGESEEMAEQHSHLHDETNAEAEIWTCSMHPQIKQKESGDCPLCGMDLIPLEASTSENPMILEMTQEAVKFASIQTTLVGEDKQNISAIVRLSGKVQTDERLVSSQVAHLAGRIEQLYVTFEGEQVQSGQKLADIYAPELIAAQRELLEAKKLTEVNPNLLEVARNKLKYWKIGVEAIKAIEENGEIQETFPLYAQASGVVVKRKVAVGDYVQQGEVLFDLMDLSKVWVLFDAYEEDLANIKLGSEIEFTTPAIPNQIFSGRVTFIDPIIDAKTRTASIRTEINNRNRQLKPEMLVYGELTSENMVSEQLTIPKTTVLWTGKRSVVYVKVPNTKIPSFQYREVEIGESVGDSYRIISGLEIGEEVVTYGSFTIDAAAQLNNQASMMNRKVDIKGEDQNAIPNFQANVPVTFQKQLATLTDAYLQLKDALVETNATDASDAAQEVLQQLKKIDVLLLEGDAHSYWMEQTDAFHTHSKEIVETKDIEEQRQQFEFLSIAMINTITAFGTTKEAIYIQHCPMAFDNEGADWLSAEEGILNPYFGDRMLKCGIVKTIFDGNMTETD
ncbi:MAG: efflux RND transporter periplasmic adaptor subunit [Bacteroidota bacterium]